MLLPERFASVILVQTLAERWWDTTHTFDIVDREMTIIPHDFHRKTGLWFNGASINLEGESSTRLGLEFFGRRYAIEMIRYTEIEANFMRHPQVAVEECVKMAKVFFFFFFVPTRGILLYQWGTDGVLMVAGSFLGL